MSKLAAGGDEERADVRVLLRARLVTREAVRARIDDVPRLDESERRNLNERLARLASA